MSERDIEGLGSLFKVPNGRAVVCYETGEEFPGSPAAAKAAGVSPTVMRNAVKTHFAIDGKHYFSEREGCPSCLSAEPSEAVTCWETALVYPNVEAVAAALKMVPEAVEKAIETGTTAGGLHWYMAEKPRPETFDVTVKGKAVVCRETGEVYRTIKTAAEAMRLMNPDCLSKAIRKGTRSGGYHWRFANKEETYNLVVNKCRFIAPENVYDPNPVHSHPAVLPEILG